MSSQNSSLKDFKVIEKLGDGSFATVFKVQRLSDKQEYAMKKECALNEVRILASITSPYIVSYKDCFIDNNDELCIIMEFCHNGDIQKELKKNTQAHKRYTENQLWKAFLDLLYGLKSLHDQNILHRDLKCANVFIDKNETYKLGDLNVSKIAKNKGLVYTQTGTPYYAAPEVWKEKPYNNKCDVWSLGCVIYEMCSFSPPFKATSMNGLYKSIIKGKFSRIPMNYSIDLQQIIEKCLIVDPDQRPDVSQLLKDPILLKYIKERGQTNKIAEGQSNMSLLDTIKCPKNLKNLIGKFPKSQYEQELPQIDSGQSSKGISNSTQGSEKQNQIIEQNKKVKDIKQRSIDVQQRVPSARIKIKSTHQDAQIIKQNSISLEMQKNYQQNEMILKNRLANIAQQGALSKRYESENLILPQINSQRPQNIMVSDDRRRMRNLSHQIDKDYVNQHYLYQKQMEERVANRQRNLLGEMSNVQSRAVIPPHNYYSRIF